MPTTPLGKELAKQAAWDSANIARVEGELKKEGKTFADIGITSAGQTVKRGPLMEFFAHTMHVEGGDTSVLNRFSDSAQLTPEQKKAMAAFVESDVVSGTGDGKLDPNGEVNRAQFAKISVNVMEATQGQEGGTNPVTQETVPTHGAGQQ